MTDVLCGEVVGCSARVLDDLPTRLVGVVRCSPAAHTTGVLRHRSLDEPSSP